MYIFVSHFLIRKRVIWSTKVHRWTIFDTNNGKIIYQKSLETILHIPNCVIKQSLEQSKFAPGQTNFE